MQPAASLKIGKRCGCIGGGEIGSTRA